MGEELLALAERCERATGPDRELDAAIAVTALGFFTVPPKWEGGPIGYGYIDGEGCEVHPGHGGMQLIRDYTASIDAAMTLVPVRNDGPHGEYVKIDLWDTNGVYPKGVQASAWVIGAKRTYAATPALALCAAALRARATLSAAASNPLGAAPSAAGSASTAQHPEHMLAVKGQPS